MTAPVLVTSLSPHRLEAQHEALASWSALGCRILSLNARDEAATVSRLFPRVEVRAVDRDARETCGRPLVYLDDALAVLGEAPGQRAGVVNSDIVLRPTRSGGALPTCRGGELWLGRRLDVAPQSDASLLVAPSGGFDYFFLAPVLARRLRGSALALGAPWWDYYLPFAALMSGARLRLDAEVLAVHRPHPVGWRDDLYRSLCGVFCDAIAARPIATGDPRRDGFLHAVAASCRRSLAAAAARGGYNLEMASIIAHFSHEAIEQLAVAGPAGAAARHGFVASEQQLQHAAPSTRPPRAARQGPSRRTSIRWT